jgi:hypothetical protein
LRPFAEIMAAPFADIPINYKPSRNDDEAGTSTAATTSGDVVEDNTINNNSAGEREPSALQSILGISRDSFYNSEGGSCLDLTCSTLQQRQLFDPAPGGSETLVAPSPALVVPSGVSSRN